MCSLLYQNPLYCSQGLASHSTFWGLASPSLVLQTGGGELCSLSPMAASLALCPLKSLAPLKHHGKTQGFCNCFCKMTYFCLLIIGRCHPSFWNSLPFLKFPALLLLNLLLESINSSCVSIKYLRTSEADSNTDCLAPQPGGIAWLFVVRISLRGGGEWVRGGRRLGNIYLLPLFKRP